MKILNLLSFCLMLLVSSTFLSCDKNKNGTIGEACNSDFDQIGLFQNLADKLILPGYAELLSDVNTLQSKTNAFTNDPLQSQLDELRNAYLIAYMQWQVMAQYEFGPAEEVSLRSSVNNFPVNADAIENNIATNQFSADQIDSYDKGFPALDYLLFGLNGGGLNTLEKLQAAEATPYLEYLTKVVNEIQEKVSQTESKWKEGYADQFINNTGTAAGSSLSLIINALNQNYELIKREKIGIPSGVLTLGIPNPTKVEALYSGESLALAEKALEASQSLYLGRSTSGSNGSGLDNYLQKVGAKKGEELLDELIQNQFTSALNALSALDTTISKAVEYTQSKVQNAYNEITKQLVNIKTDLPSVLCVSITYVDNPSDND